MIIDNDNTDNDDNNQSDDDDDDANDDDADVTWSKTCQLFTKYFKNKSSYVFSSVFSNYTALNNLPELHCNENNISCDKLAHTKMSIFFMNIKLMKSCYSQWGICTEAHFR